MQETLTDGIIKLEKSLENLNVRLARLLAEYSASQAKIKQRIAKLEIRYVYIACCKRTHARHDQRTQTSQSLNENLWVPSLSQLFCCYVICYQIGTNMKMHFKNLSALIR